MPLSEKSIESAIDSLKRSPGTFQRLVEYYAALTYPHRFKELIPQGRDHNDVTVKGWPDTYSLSPSGLIDVVEATHSPAWSQHLEDDLKKAEALGKGRLSGFLFVAWANEPSPLTDHKKKNQRYELLRSYRDRLAALDIPPENINFVFKKQLVRSLAQPRFTAILTDTLQLPGDSYPFNTISRTEGIFGASGGYDVFAPSKEEYESGLVHRASITDEVEERLDSLGWAWLRGRGAAGKTVLAIHVGRGYESRSLPAYYLDLSKTDVSVSDALNVITTHADDGVLFVIDNVHLNQAFARNCFDHWQSVAAGSHLLLIGRDTTTFDYRGTALPLDELRAEALTLKVTQEDLEGVFLRLVRRAPLSSGTVPALPQGVLQHWHKLFGGDLIAFSAAVAQRLKRLSENDWTIQAQDAAKYVRAAYLAKADEVERLNLLRLAVLAQLELDVPEEALELAKLEPFLQNGLVHFIERGRDNRYGFYHLVHPGLGDLLLTAAGYSDGALRQFILEQWGYIASRNPHSGTYIVTRLESRDRMQEATLILKGIAELENGLEEILIKSGLQYLRGNSERLTRLGVLSETEIEQRLVSISSKVCESAFRTQLNFLPNTLRYVEERLPRVWAALEVELARPERVKALTEKALRMPGEHLAHFLGYAEERLPEVWAALEAELARPEGIGMLTEKALWMPLNNLSYLLGYVEEKLPGVWAALEVELARPQRIKALTERTLQVPVEHLVPFFRYVEERLPGVWAALPAELARPEGITVLMEKALRMQVERAISFFRYVEERLPGVWTALEAELAQLGDIKTLREAVLQMPLERLTSTLGQVEEKLPGVWAALEAELARPEGINMLAEKVLQAQPHDLTTCLRHVEERLPGVWTALEAELARPERVNALAEKSLQMSLEHLTHLLESVDQALPNLSQLFKDKLTDPTAINTIAEMVCRTPLEKLLSFLQAVTFSPAVLLAVDHDNWVKSRQDGEYGSPHHFPAIVKLFLRSGRPELAEAPAVSFIKAARQHQWFGQGIGLHHLSYVLTFGRAAGAETVNNFITRIVTPDWLEEKYTESPTYGIAAALFSLWGYYEEPVLAHFRTEPLKSRVRSELNNLSGMSPEDLSAATQLLGVSALSGMRVGKIKVTWPNIDRINDAARLTIPAAEAAVVSNITIQFWLGLRVMVGMRPDDIHVQPQIGDRVLSLWKNTTGYTNKQNALNKWMIDWMEQCSRAGWMLVDARR